MGKFKYFFAILASVAVVILFQNCGDIRLSPGSESINSTSEQLSCVDPSGSSPTVVVSSLSETDQYNLNAYVLETRLSDNQTLTSTRTFEWSFDENPQPAGASLSVNVAQLVACSTHKVTAKWIDACEQPQELTQIYTQYGEGCPPPPEPPIAPVQPPAPEPKPVVDLCVNNRINKNTDADFDTDIGKNFRVTIDHNKSHSFRIRTGAAGRAGHFVTGPDPIGMNVNKFMSVSTSPCDFDYSYLDLKTGCANSTQDPKVLYKVASADSPPSLGYCHLLPDTVYYINIRNEFAETSTRAGDMRGIDTCGAGIICGFVFGFQ